MTDDITPWERKSFGAVQKALSDTLDISERAERVLKYLMKRRLRRKSRVD